MDAGRCCLLASSVECAEAVQRSRKLKDSARLLFLTPPSVQVLEARLRGWGSLSEEALQARLASAEEEMSCAKMVHLWDEVFTVRDPERTYGEVRGFLARAIPTLLGRPAAPEMAAL